MVSTVDYWVRVLAEHGHADNDDDRLRVARFLFDNEFCNRASLIGAEHPKHWPGADAFSAGELSGLSNVCRHAFDLCCIPACSGTRLQANLQFQA